MSKINWSVRLKNKTFWITVIPALLVLIASVLKIFDIEIDFNDLSNKLTEVVYSVFTVLAILGIVTDHTTEGFGDSEQALDYEEPKKIEENEEEE